MPAPSFRCVPESAITEHPLPGPWHRLARVLKRCYDWTLAWAEHPQASLALFFIAVIEASVFPIPPDVLLIALGLGAPAAALRFAAIATAGSVLGAVLGYAIGAFMFAAIAAPLLEFYHAMDEFARLEEWFAAYGVGIVLLAGFSPIPFKVVTIAAGAFGLSFVPFVLACAASRGARFFLEGALLRWGGARLRALVEDYFDWITAAVALLVVGGFAVLWLW